MPPDARRSLDAVLMMKPMNSGNQHLLKGGAAGAIIAVLASLLALALPSEMGGYNDWADWQLALHNVAAILTRVVVFAAIGAALAAISGRPRHRREVGNSR
jgi:hypothetical protein